MPFKKLPKIVTLYNKYSTTKNIVINNVNSRTARNFIYNTIFEAYYLCDNIIIYLDDKLQNPVISVSFINRSKCAWDTQYSSLISIRKSIFPKYFVNMICEEFPNVILLHNKLTIE